MEPIRRILVACILQGCAIAVPMLFGGSQNANAAEVASCAATYRSSLDARLSAKAGEGVVAMRRFIERTRMIYQLDDSSAAARVERYRREREACEAQRVAPK